MIRTCLIICPREEFDKFVPDNETDLFGGPNLLTHERFLLKLPSTLLIDLLSLMFYNGRGEIVLLICLDLWEDEIVNM